MYVAKAHLHYSIEEFLDSTYKEIINLWILHRKFNGWDESKKETKKVFVEDIFN